MASGVISNWHLLIEEFQTSAQEFYRGVEEAAKRRSIPDIEFSRVEWKEGGFASAKREYLRVGRGRLAFDICAAPFGTGFFFSWWLARVPPKHPFLWGCGGLIGFFLALAILAWIALRLGTFGFFLFVASLPLLIWFLGKIIREGDLIDEDEVLALPYVGWLYQLIFSPVTYYRMDTAIMFQESVRAAVMEMVEQVRNEHGLRALSEEEKRPRLRDLAR